MESEAPNISSPKAWLKSVFTAFLDLLGLVSILFLGKVFVVATIPNSGGGGGLDWLMILSVVTVGLFPLCLIVGFFLAKRLILRAIKLCSEGRITS
jgi:hypothetical protein